MRRRAESWGAAVVAVTPELPDGPALLAGTALNFLPAAERPEASPWRRWEIGIPIALIAAMALVATALPIWQKRGYAIALGHLTDQARVQADASSALRAQLERLTGDYNFALQKKYAFPSTLQSVDDVTKLLPDDTWLTQLEMKGIAKGKEPHREILVRGESGNAGRLISLFEDSKLFEQAAPRSPTTKIQPGPGEIFDLGAQLKPLPPPQPVELAMNVATPAVAPSPPVHLPAPVPARPARRGAGGRETGAGRDAARRVTGEGRRGAPRRARCTRRGGSRRGGGARSSAAEGGAMNAAIAKLPPDRQRLLAIALLVAAVVLVVSACWCRCCCCTSTTTTRSRS